MNGYLLSIFVAAVCIALTLGDILSTLENSGKNSTPVFDDKRSSSKTAAVIVAGAWRLPSGELSRAFKNRVLAGARVALLTGTSILLLTGGRNESHQAKKFLLELRNSSTLIFPPPVEDQQLDEDEHHQLSPAKKELAWKLAREIGDFETFGEFLESSRQQQRTQLNILVENVSTTTAENAVFAAEILRRVLAGIDHESESESDASVGGGAWCPDCTFVVVSSPYHLLRCKVLFSKHLSSAHATTGRTAHPINVLTYGSSRDEQEYRFPQEKIIFSSTTSFSSSGGVAMIANELVPTKLAQAAHTVYMTYRHWRAYLRTAMMSMTSYMRVREMGAIGKSLFKGSMTFDELADEIFK